MNENNKSMTAADWLSLLLSFCGVGLIAAGLWMFSIPLARIFLGLTCLYVGASVFKAANSPERTVKK